MRGIHYVLATMLAMTMLPLAEAATLDVTVPISKLCWRAPDRGPNFDALDPVLPDSLERVAEHWEDLEFWCSNHLEDFEV